MKSIIVHSIHTGKSEPVRGRPDKRSAINKCPVDGLIRLGHYGLEGDQIVDTRYHGGPFKALCVYAREYYAHWKETCNVEMPFGSFGENLSTEGMLDGDVCIGDIYELGPAKLQCAGPRGPCSILAAHWDIPKFAAITRDERKTGFYFRTLEGGLVEAGMALQLIERPHPEWTLPRFWDILDKKDGTPEEAQALLDYEPCDPDWAPKLKRLLG